jgi:hypothetical protein
MTYAPADLLAIQRYAHDRTGMPWDALGIIHGTPQGGGYHEGHDLLHAAGRAPEDPGSDYSYAESQRDRSGLTDAGSAFDLGGDFGRFREITLAIVHACERGDPRTRDVREVIYTPDGNVVRRWDRLGRRSSGDSSHLSHTHISFFRDAEGRRNQPDNFLGLLRELFEGVDDVGISDIDTAYLIWRVEALVHMFDTIRGGPEKGATVDIVKQVKQLATGLADLKAAAGQSTVTLSDADRAAITQALAGAVPTAEQIATAVLDEQHRRDAA